MAVERSPYVVPSIMFECCEFLKQVWALVEGARAHNNTLLLLYANAKLQRFVLSPLFL